MYLTGLPSEDLLEDLEVETCFSTTLLTKVMQAVLSTQRAG